MKISKKEVIHIANLSRLYLSKEEIEKYSDQLSDIIEYIDELNLLDLNEIDPTFHIINLKNVMREDKIKGSLDVKESLKAAPERFDNFYTVPKIIE